jgi:hypothetical protein
MLRRCCASYDYLQNQYARITPKVTRAVAAKNVKQPNCPSWFGNAAASLSAFLTIPLKV